MLSLLTRELDALVSALPDASRIGEWLLERDDLAFSRIGERLFARDLLKLSWSGPGRSSPRGVYDPTE